MPRSSLTRKLVPGWDYTSEHLHFSVGVTQRVVIDNLKSAMIKAQVTEPILEEAYRKFAQHYHFLVSPNPLASPWLKGKVENEVN